jgi:hypothetical protein
LQFARDGEFVSLIYTSPLVYYSTLLLHPAPLSSPSFLSSFELHPPYSHVFPPRPSPFRTYRCPYLYVSPCAYTPTHARTLGLTDYMQVPIFLILPPCPSSFIHFSAGNPFDSVLPFARCDNVDNRFRDCYKSPEGKMFTNFQNVFPIGRIAFPFCCWQAHFTIGLCLTYQRFQYSILK